MFQADPGFTQFSYFRGRVALAAILKGLGVRPGDEVGLQAFTCVAVPEAIMAVGATPVYVDVNGGGYNMDPGAFEAVLAPRMRAVIVQHSFGIPADLPALLRVANARGVPIVEDCAHTVASTLNGKLVGTFGAAAFYSFEASKPIFIGLGGSARSNRSDLTAQLSATYSSYTEPSVVRQTQLLTMYLAHRVLYRPSTYWTVRRSFRALVSLGFAKGNYNQISDERSPDFSHSLGTFQRRLLARSLRVLSEQTTHRRRVASEYSRLISSPYIAHPVPPAGADPVYGRYPMLSTRKAELTERAPEARVELADFYATPVHPFSGSALEQVGYRPGQCPNAEATCAKVVSLPTGPQVTDREIERAAAFLGSI